MQKAIMRSDSRKDLLDQIRDLQTRLDEAEETLRALGSGEVDAVLVSGPQGERVYTLVGADETYRIMVQNMSEGALTLGLDGLVLFANEQFAAMLELPLQRVIGAPSAISLPGKTPSCSPRFSPPPPGRRLNSAKEIFVRPGAGAHFREFADA